MHRRDCGGDESLRTLRCDAVLHRAAETGWASGVSLDETARAAYRAMRGVRNRSGRYGCGVPMRT